MGALLTLTGLILIQENVLKPSSYSLWTTLTNKSSYLQMQDPQAPTRTRFTAHFLIIGGGLSGLAAAIALRRVDHDVVVLERESGLDQVRGFCQHRYTSNNCSPYRVCPATLVIVCLPMYDELCICMRPASDTLTPEGTSL